MYKKSMPLCKFFKGDLWVWFWGLKEIAASVSYRNPPRNEPWGADFRER